MGDSAPVKWSYNGAVIGPLSLQYDASGILSDASPSITASAPKSGQTSGTYTYNWSVPSGAQTNSVKTRVRTASGRIHLLILQPALRSLPPQLLRLPRR